MVILMERHTTGYGHTTERHISSYSGLVIDYPSVTKFPLTLRWYQQENEDQVLNQLNQILEKDDARRKTENDL